MNTIKILIVEDSMSIVMMYLEVLKGLNADVIPLVAATYEKAKKLLSQESVDLIILDLFLPDCIATDILEDIRESHPQVPIFMVTGHPEELDQVKANQFGVKQFFTKPIRIDAFAQAIKCSTQSVWNQ
jgi:two-component system, CitB family, response regulator CitT